MKIKKNYSGWKDIFLFIGIFAVVLLFKSNTLNNPFHWDALVHVKRSLLIAEEGIYSFRFSLLFFCLALFYNLFGFSIILTHIIVVFFAASVLFVTYKLADYLFGSKIAYGSIILLFFSPLFYSQSGIINKSIPLTLMIVLCVYCLFKKKFVFYGLFFILACLSKENGLIVFMPIFLITWIMAPKGKGKTISLVKITIPFLLILAYYAIAFFGKIPSNFNYYLNLVDFRTVEGIFYRIKYTFFDFFRLNPLAFYFLIFSVLFFTSGKDKKMPEKKYTIMMLFLGIYIFVFLLFFGIYTRQLSRHWLSVYPYLAIVVSCLLERGLERKKGFYYPVLLLMAALSFYFCYKPFVSNINCGSGAKMEKNMSYLNVIKSHRMATEYLQDQYPDKVIATFWPLTMELRYPQLGYVKKLIKPRSLFFDFFMHRNEILNLAPDSFDIILYSPQMHHSKEVYRYIKKFNFKLTVSFKSGGCISQVYTKQN